MAEHLHQVMTNPHPADPAELVDAIATLPPAGLNGNPSHHWSFASKIAHFFIDGDQYPIYDSYCRAMVVHHLGGECLPDGPNPYAAFRRNVERLRELSWLACSLRDMDRYLWVAGHYREWLRARDKALNNAELRSLF